MGDRCYLRIDLYGEIGSIEALLEIANAAQTEGFNEMTNDAAAIEWIADALVDEALYFEMDECNYGNIEDFEFVLEEHSISYTIRHEAGGAYPGESKSWFASENTTYEVYMIGGECAEAAIPLGELEVAVKQGTEAVQRLLDHASKAEGAGMPKLSLSQEVQEYLAKREAAQALGVANEPAAN